MNAFRTAKLVALSCAIFGAATFSTGCALEVDEAEYDEHVAVADADLGTFNGADGEEADDEGERKEQDEQDREIVHASDGSSRAMGEGDNCLNFEALMDPDPVSWRPAPTTGEDESGTDTE